MSALLPFLARRFLVLVFLACSASMCAEPTNAVALTLPAAAAH